MALRPEVTIVSTVPQNSHEITVL